MALQKLSFALLERHAAGDFAGASVVTSLVARTYSGRRDAVASVLGITPQRLPVSADDYWSSNTKLVVGGVLLSALRDANGGYVSPAAERAGAAMLETFPSSAAGLGAFFRTYIDPAFGQNDMIRQYAAVAAGYDTSALNAVLQPLVTQQLACVSAAPEVPKTTPAPIPAPRPAQTIDPIRIVGDRGRSQFPTWGYYVIGGLAIAVIGVVAYQQVRS